MTYPTALVELPDADDSIEIKDFTIPVRRIRFRIAPEVYEAHPMLGLPLMQQLTRLGRTIGDITRSTSSDDDDSGIEKKLDVIYAIFDKLLLPESADRFKARIAANEVDTTRQLIPIVMHLLEAYGARPTQPSSDSSTGSPSGTGGTSSTDAASSVVSASPS